MVEGVVEGVGVDQRPYALGRLILSSSRDKTDTFGQLRAEKVNHFLRITFMPRERGASVLLGAVGLSLPGREGGLGSCRGRWSVLLGLLRLVAPGLARRWLGVLVRPRSRHLGFLGA